MFAFYHISYYSNSVLLLGIFILLHKQGKLIITKIWNFRVTKSSYEIEFRKMTSQFELLIRKYLQKYFFQVINSTP